MTARRTADVCVYTITDDRISRSILDAHRRGVKIRIISDHDKSFDPGSDIQKFREDGIAVKLDDIHKHSDRSRGQDGHMHHKFAIFDGVRLLNGSYNWTRGAADTNYENIVDTDDAKLVAAFAAEFERLWKRF
jgi:phosphatidylserine/phosphatidylglycerophosphate/cardiolipin synthase-like enzyme